MGVIIFNGSSSKDYGIQVENPPGYHTPERDYEMVHIPGRNGDLIIDNGSYKNVNKSYNIAFGKVDGDFTLMASQVASWLNSAEGYARLEDSYEPDYYRMASFKNSLDIENILSQAGRVTIDFDCKPQRFLKSGDIPIIIENEEVDHYYSKDIIVENPTNQTAYPIIKLTGYFTEGSGYAAHLSIYKDDKHNSHVRINQIGHRTPNQQITIGTIIIDSGLQDVYEQYYNSYINRNEDIVFETYSGKSTPFPIIYPGSNTITLQVFGQYGRIDRMEVIPKWWTL